MLEPGGAGNLDSLFAMVRDGQLGVWGELQEQLTARLVALVRRGFPSLPHWQAEEAALEGLEALFLHIQDVASWQRAWAYIRSASGYSAQRFLRKSGTCVRVRTHTHTHTHTQCAEG
jgi:hypothetical protein